MISELLERSSLFSLLHRIDRDLAEEHRQKRCPVCGGPLHQSNYPRKPRGGPEDLPEEILVRRSFCCGTEGCRVRSLPPSCLFMGRRVYWGVVVHGAACVLGGGDPGGHDPAAGAAGGAEHDLAATTVRSIPQDAVPLDRVFPGFVSTSGLLETDTRQGGCIDQGPGSARRVGRMVPGAGGGCRTRPGRLPSISGNRTRKFLSGFVTEASFPAEDGEFPCGADWVTSGSKIV